MSFWACSRLFQKVSPAIKASSSARRFCVPGTSKKPPQMRKLLRHRCQLNFNYFEHVGNIRDLGVQIQCCLHTSEIALAGAMQLKFNAKAQSREAAMMRNDQCPMTNPE